MKLATWLTGKQKNLQLVPELRQGKLKGWEKNGFFFLPDTATIMESKFIPTTQRNSSETKKGTLFAPNSVSFLAPQMTYTFVPKDNDFSPAICYPTIKCRLLKGTNFYDLMMNFGEKLKSYPRRMNLRLVQEGRLGEWIGQSPPVDQRVSTSPNTIAKNGY